jgi:hypothetical protein
MPGAQDASAGGRLRLATATPFAQAVDGEANREGLRFFATPFALTTRAAALPFVPR